MDDIHSVSKRVRNQSHVSFGSRLVLFSALSHFPPFYPPLIHIETNLCSHGLFHALRQARIHATTPKELAGESSDSTSPHSLLGLLKSFHQHYECPDTQSGHVTCPSPTVGGGQTGLADLQSRAPLNPPTAHSPLGTSLRSLSLNAAPACLPAQRRPAARACGTLARPAMRCQPRGRNPCA